MIEALGLIVTIVIGFLSLKKVRQKIGLEKSIPSKFDGEIAHLSKDFEAFIASNEGKVIFINAYIEEEGFYGDIDSSEPYFVVYEEAFGSI